MNRLISGRIFQKMAALIKKIIIGIVMIVICLFIYEELVGPAIAYILEKPKYNIRALKESDNLSFLDLQISDSGELAKVGDPVDIFDISKFEYDFPYTPKNIPVFLLIPASIQILAASPTYI